MVSGTIPNLDSWCKKSSDEEIIWFASEGATMSDEIRFADSWCDGMYMVIPSSEEYMQVKQNYDRSSSGCHRSHIIGQVRRIAKASEPILISVC